MNKVCRGIFLIFMLFALSPISEARQGVSANFPPIRMAPAKPGVFVHLFEWRWNDIALECENFLGPKGYSAIQVSPPMEHAVLPGFPWFQRYQVVSYQLTSRSGTRAEFAEMVRRCRNARVDVYVDAILNHTTWVNRSGQPKYGFAGTPYDEYNYPGLYSPNDFHRCGRNGDDSIANYQDRWEVQNCNLATLADLRTETDYVRGRLSDYLNDLLSLEVSGFRIDAAKHIPMFDIQALLRRLRVAPYIYQEVIDFGGEPIRSTEYLGNGDVYEFRYSTELARVFLSGQLAWLVNFGPAWPGFGPSDRSVVFVDNHDMQRGHGAGLRVLTHKDGQKYALANIFMLAWPYGYPQVMSSYRFNDSSQGPPTDPRGITLPVYFNNSLRCGQEWVCEHRWAPIASMVSFHNFTEGAEVSRWWSNGNNQIAFARTRRGFLALNNEPQTMDRWFDTGLPPGNYCDILSGDFIRSKHQCSGNVIAVNDQGWASIKVGPWNAVAIYGGSRINTFRPSRAPSPQPITLNARQKPGTSLPSLRRGNH